MTSAKVLLQSMPSSIGGLIEHGLHQARLLPGVADVSNVHVWTNAPGAPLLSLL